MLSYIYDVTIVRQNNERIGVASWWGIINCNDTQRLLFNIGTFIDIEINISFSYIKHYRYFDTLHYLKWMRVAMMPYARRSPTMACLRQDGSNLINDYFNWASLISIMKRLAMARRSRAISFAAPQCHFLFIYHLGRSIAVPLTLWMTS